MRSNDTQETWMLPAYIGSPDVHPVLRGKIELVSGLHIECRVPCVEVAHGVYPELSGGVVVGHHLLPERSLSRLRCPGLCEAEEEMPVAGEAALDGSGLAREGGAVRIVGSGKAAEVGDVLIQRLLTIHGEVGKGFVGVVLCGESGGGRVEVRQVGGFPPVAHTPCGIERA